LWFKNSNIYSEFKKFCRFLQNVTLARIETLNSFPEILFNPLNINWMLDINTDFFHHKYFIFKTCFFSPSLLWMISIECFKVLIREWLIAAVIRSDSWFDNWKELTPVYTLKNIKSINKKAYCSDWTVSPFASFNLKCVLRLYTWDCL